MSEPVIHLDVICYYDQEEGLYVAHCLQLDLVTTDKSQDQVCTDMVDLIETQIRFAIENDNLENLFKPAPPEIWKLFSKATTTGERPIKNTSFSDLYTFQFNKPRVEIQSLYA